LWEWLERRSTIKSGWSAADLFRRLADKEDHTASLEEHLTMLREAGFTAACLQLELNRAVFVGRLGRSPTKNALRTAVCHTSLHPLYLAPRPGRSETTPGSA